MMQAEQVASHLSEVLLVCRVDPKEKIFTQHQAYKIIDNVTGCLRFHVLDAFDTNMFGTNGCSCVLHLYKVQ